jgi:ubiquitin-protein ligase
LSLSPAPLYERLLLLNLPPSDTRQETNASTHLHRSTHMATLHQGHCPLGMYVTPSHESLLIWDAVFFVHQGYYADAILRFQVTFPPSYPERQPNVQFLTDIFHPLIAQQTREFNLSPRFRPWRPKEHHVFDILHWIKAAFKKHALDGMKEVDCLNKEAYRCRSFLMLLEPIVHSLHRLYINLSPLRILLDINFISGIMRIHHPSPLLPSNHHNYHRHRRHCIVPPLARKEKVVSSFVR